MLFLIQISRATRYSWKKSTHFDYSISFSIISNSNFEYLVKKINFSKNFIYLQKKNYLFPFMFSYIQRGILHAGGMLGTVGVRVGVEGIKGKRNFLDKIKFFEKLFEIRIWNGMIKVRRLFPYRRDDVTSRGAGNLNRANADWCLRVSSAHLVRNWTYSIYSYENYPSQLESDFHLCIIWCRKKNI